MKRILALLVALLCLAVPAGAKGAAGDSDAPVYCVLWSEGIGIEYVTACHEHRQLLLWEDDLTGMEGEAREAALKALIDDWYAALDSLCAEWAALPDADAEAVQAAREAFEQSIRLHAVLYAPYDSGLDWELAAVRNECMRLCGQLHLVGD